MELDIRKILNLFWKKSWLIAASAIVLAIAAYVYSAFAITPLYSARTMLYVYNNENRKNTATVTSSDIAVSQQLVDTYVVLLKSNSVLEEVAQTTRLGYTASEISRMFSAAAVNQTEVFNITVTCEVPEHAAILANAIAEVGKEVILQVVKAGSVEVIDVASVPWSPSYPNETQNAIIGFVLGALICAAVILVREVLDTRVKNVAMLIDMFDLPILGVVPSIEMIGRLNKRKRTDYFVEGQK